MGELRGEERSWLEPAWRFQRDGWIFVHVEGEAFARGFAHGFLLAKEIDAGIRENNFQNEWSAGDGPEYFAEAAEMIYAAKLDDDLRREIEGITEGIRRAGYSYEFRDLLAWNATIELTGNWWPIDKGKPLGELRTGEHCNSFIATGDGVTAYGGIVLAHNTRDTYIDANSSNIVLDLVPDQGARILMQTRPGYIHSGTDFFLCGSGIIGAETTIAGLVRANWLEPGGAFRSLRRCAIPSAASTAPPR